MNKKNTEIYKIETVSTSNKTIKELLKELIVQKYKLN